MKKLYIAVFFLLAGFIQSAAQGIYRFWGTTDKGGTDDQGVLFSSKYDGTGVRLHNVFEIITPGSRPLNQGVVSYNGRLYGVSPNGGELNTGLIYEYNPVTNTYTKLVDFFRIGGDSPTGSMVLFQGRLYGVTTSTISGDPGLLYEYDPATKTLSVKHYFQEATGSWPGTELVVYNNKLYGATSNGGGMDVGTLFSYDPVNNVYTSLAGLNNAVGFSITSPLLPYNNRLYGVATSGGLGNAGTLFEFNPANNTITKKADIGSLGTGSGTGLVRVGNKLYGGTLQGGVNNNGMIFEYDLVQGTLVKKIDMSQMNGRAIVSRMLLYNNKLYGLTSAGGPDDDGVLFEYDPATNTYLKKVNFNRQTMGATPCSHLVLLNDRFYSVTLTGGATDFGTLFEYNPDANGVTAKVDFMRSATGYLPKGKLTYYSGKLYGITQEGGENYKGVIYSYDLATGTYAVRHNMTTATGSVYEQGGMILYNNKLYGVARSSEIGGGVLYEFDPLNDNYTVKHYFSEASGNYPEGTPVLYNNKLYGLTHFGGSNDKGVLYEYDLATNTYSARVTLGPSFGMYPYSTLILHNNRLYGVTAEGGANGAGTLFEYIPAGNGFIKRYDFSDETGGSPIAALTVFNNKLYGISSVWGNEGWDGVLYEYDLAASTYTLKHHFELPGGIDPSGNIMVYNNKLYGIAGDGGVNSGGALYEYDPVLNSYKEPTSFTFLSDKVTTQLITVPALVAPGTPGSCTDIGNTPINAANANQWVSFTDEYGNAVLEINANGNMLGNVSVQFYTHNGATRKDEAGRLYLDRNISIKVDNQPATPVSIRLYVRKVEFESLKNTPGAGVLNVSDLAIFKNSENCSTVAGYSATPISTTVTTWGLDYVYTAQVSSFSSFYFASKAYSALPVKLEYLKGVAEATVNRLQWKASCTENTDFIVERSTDGIHFSQIGLVWASVADCGKPFQFPDQHPVNGKAWYRLQMKEASGAVTYSSIIMIDRRQAQSLSIQLAPNPVTGSSAIFSIYSPGNKTVPVAIYDATGKLMARMQWQLQPGSQVRTIDVQKLPAGIYQAVWYEESATKAIRFVRQ